MFEFKVDGLDELQKQLENMEKAAKELEGTKEIPLTELFTDDFMKRNTDFSTLDEMFEAFGYSNSTQEEFEKIPDEEIDLKVSNSTIFSSWQDMLDKALDFYVSDKLGF